MIESDRHPGRTEVEDVFSLSRAVAIDATAVLLGLDVDPITPDKNGEVTIGGLTCDLSGGNLVGRKVNLKGIPVLRFLGILNETEARLALEPHTPFGKKYNEARIAESTPPEQRRPVAAARPAA